MLLLLRHTLTPLRAVLSAGRMRLSMMMKYFFVLCAKARDKEEQLTQHGKFSKDILRTTLGSAVPQCRRGETTRLGSGRVHQAFQLTTKGQQPLRLLRCKRHGSS